MRQKLYVDVNEVCSDWGCSRAKGYQMIKELNEKNCYGLAKEV